MDVICLEEKSSEDDRIRYYQTRATLEFLQELLEKNHYNGIVNFLHYPEPEDYKPYHELLTENTEHLIFLSSYRVYADMEHPVTEKAPRLLDVSGNEEFLTTEKYAVSKAKCEDYIRSLPDRKNWTIVRPVISFSERRFDIVMTSRREVIEKSRAGRKIILPLDAKNRTAGLDWSGNSGKLIANLLFKKDALGEAFTISSAPNLTWGQVADIYTELLGAEFEWLELENYKAAVGQTKEDWGLIYDRLFDRRIDNAKVLRVTGLQKEDFLSVKEGVQRELEKVFE